MKSTDYYGRAAAMDFYLMGKPDLIGIEVGCDVGAHAMAMLETLSIQKLVLVDIWRREWCKGYCEGRLSRWKTKTEFLEADSIMASTKFYANSFDFIYIDIEHDYATVKGSLMDWWDKLKFGGLLGYRNYSTCQKAIDEFIKVNKVKFEIDKYHNEIILFK